MSIKVKIDSLDYSMREQIAKELNIKLTQSSYMTNKPKSVYIQPFSVLEDDIFLPFSYAVRNGLNRPDRKETRRIVFDGSLREEQKKIRNEIMKYLNKQGCCIVSTYTGMGKTVLGINMASLIGLKTLVIVNRLILVDQWKKAISTFCPSATLTYLTPKSVSTNADFYIMNAVNIPKMGHNFFKDIQFVIVDECHLILAELLSTSLQYITPRYLLGLSATPYRPDGMDVLFELYFGQSKIHRALFHPHIVYKVETGFRPTIQSNRIGRIDWSVALSSQATSIERNELIISIVKQFPKRTFLILCKRIDQATYLINRFEEEGESITSLIGTQREYDVDSRVLVATVQKAGVGFNHPKLDTLIIASDMEEYFLQYLGRVFRTEEVEPVVFDLVDDNYIMKKHFKTREHEYLKAGGVIKPYGKSETREKGEKRLLKKKI